MGLPVKLDDKETYHLFFVIDGYASEWIVQFFFEDIKEHHGFNVIILNEKNRLDIPSLCERSKNELVRNISYFYLS